MGPKSIVKENYLDILRTFLLGVVFLFIGSVVGVTLIPPEFRGIINIAFFIVILFSAFSKKSGFIQSKMGMYVYAAVLGVLTGSAYIYYFNLLGAGTFFTVVIGVILIFMLAYVIAAKSSEENIFKLGPIVTVGIISLLIIQFVGIFFFDFTSLDIVISSIGIGVYSIYAVIIMKSIQVRCRYGRLSEGEVANLAYAIFISFLNLLLDLLRLVGIFEEN